MNRDKETQGDWGVDSPTLRFVNEKQKNNGSKEKGQEDDEKEVFEKGQEKQQKEIDCFFNHPAQSGVVIFYPRFLIK